MATTKYVAPMTVIAAGREVANGDVPLLVHLILPGAVRPLCQQLGRAGWVRVSGPKATCRRCLDAEPPAPESLEASWLDGAREFLTILVREQSALKRELLRIEAELPKLDDDIARVQGAIAVVERRTS